MSIIILHLSDIHIKLKGDSILAQAEKIAAAVYGPARTASFVFVVVSGDIAQSGLKNEYDLAINFLLEIKNFIVTETGATVAFIVVPGNHDCDFSSVGKAREGLLKSLPSFAEDDIDDSIIDSMTSVQLNYYNFCGELYEGQEVLGDKLWGILRFNVEGKIIEFNTLNLSWVSQRYEVLGSIFFPLSKYASREKSDADVRVTVFHHPYNWLLQPVYRAFRGFVRRISSLVITGHEHEANAGYNSDLESEDSFFVEGGVLHDRSGKLGSTFNVISIDLADEHIDNNIFEWSKDHYSERSERFSHDFKVALLDGGNEFPILESFLNIVNDPGVYLKHPSKIDLQLSDIYVFPHLRKSSFKNSKKVFQSATHLLNIDNIRDGAVVEGDEKAGRTSLLYQLFLDYHARGFVPVYLNMKNMRRISDGDLESQLKKSISAQYGKDKYEKFSQLKSEQKIIFVDDFDQCPLKAGKAIIEFINKLRSEFGGLVVAVGEMFEMHELLVDDTSGSLALDHFVIQQFGYLMRGRLIHRWFEIGNDITVSAADILARRHEAEKLMNSLMKKSIIPSYPLYLLVVLQGIDAGRGGEFKDSALGHYYNYLLVDAFKQNGVGMDKITELFQYCSLLAWFFHSHDVKEISHLEFREFNSGFTQEWHTVDFQQRVDLLVAAKVIKVEDERYSFRYPYIFYYLKGYYLAQNITLVENREYIKHCCKHLYVRDYANTILFLTHHSSDEIVLRSIEDSISEVFKACAPIHFNGDTLQINRLLESIPRLVYSGGSPKENRDAVNEAKDEYDGDDGLVDKEEESEELSDIAQMIVLFKTTEILGQILKNQYATINRPRKRELLQDIFLAPLRALKYLYSHIEENPDALASEIGDLIRKKNQNVDEIESESMARKMVASLIQLISFSFIQKTALNISSQNLHEDIANLVGLNPQISNRLIEMAVLLDSPKGFPKDKLLKLHLDVKDNIVAARVLDQIVLNRMYMFKLNEKDLQWINQEFGVEIDSMHSITYQQKSGRLLQ